MLNYNNITNDFKGDKPSVKVSLAKYYLHEKKRYYPDGKNVIFDFSEKEYEIAVWLSKTFNENVYLNPRVNYPEGIKTSDYIFKGERWDLKSIIGNSTQVFYHAIYKNKEQSSNFIFDITKSKINMKSALELANVLYGRSDIIFLDKIIILDNNEFMVLKRV